MADTPAPTEKPGLDTEAGQAQYFNELLTSDPEIRSATLKALNKLHPELIMPEVAADQKLEAAMKKVREDTLKEIEEKQQQTAAEAAVEADKKAAMHGRDEEQVKKIEQLMLDKHIGSYSTAAELYDLSTKPAEPTPPALMETRDLLPNREDHKALWANPKRYAQDKAAEALNDIVTGKVKF